MITAKVTNTDPQRDERAQQCTNSSTIFILSNCAPFDEQTEASCFVYRYERVLSIINSRALFQNRRKNRAYLRKIKRASTYLVKSYDALTHATHLRAHQARIVRVRMTSDTAIKELDYQVSLELKRSAVRRLRPFR